MRADPAAILALPLRVGEYGMVPLSRVARLRRIHAVEPILHDGGKRRAALMVNLRTSNLAGYVKKARDAVNAEVKLPPGYRIEFGGQFHQLEAAQKRLSIVVPAALILIFLLVYAALGSVKEAAIGFIALSGIAMLNGLVLVDHINSLRDGRDGDALPVDEAVRRGARDRLRPVLSTALVASIGFLPMAIASGAGAEVQRPLATVVIGGIVTSTLLTLLLLPSLYRWLSRESEVAARRGDRQSSDGAFPPQLSAFGRNSPMIWPIFVPYVAPLPTQTEHPYTSSPTDDRSPLPLHRRPSGRRACPSRSHPARTRGRRIRR